MNQSYRLNTKNKSHNYLFLIVVVTVVIMVASLISILLYKSHKDHVDPSRIYGNWKEIGAPLQRTEILTFSPQGVHRDHRLIATSYEFDGRMVKVVTGSGQWVYERVGTERSPQLKRLTPALPPQRFILEGYETTVNMDGGGVGIGQNRRAALREHFTTE